MKGYKILPTPSLKNEGMVNILKGIHKPVSYVERYNYRFIDYINDDGKRLPVEKLFKKGGIKKGFAHRRDSELMVFQNNFVFEIEIEKGNVEFRVLDNDINRVKNVYKSYAKTMRFEGEPENYPVDINKDLEVVEMINKNHYMFSLDIEKNNIPLPQILDMKRLLNDNERFVFQVVMHPLNNEWLGGYNKAMKEFKDGKMPSKISVNTDEALQFGLNLGLVAITELVGFIEEMIFGDSEVTKMDMTLDSVSKMNEEGMSIATKGKSSSVAYEVAVRGFCYSSLSYRREMILNHFKNCFNSIEGDNSLIMKTLKMNKYNIKRLKGREIMIHPCDSSRMILSVKELAQFIQLPKASMQREFDMMRLDFEVSDIPDELLEGDIPIGGAYGNVLEKAFWNNDKDIMCLSKLIVGIKGSGKSSYLENYTYFAHKKGDCVIYFDYIENCLNAKEVSRFVSKEDVITLDLSDGFNFSYPELDTLGIDLATNEGLEKMQDLTSDYSNLVSGFVDTINIGQAEKMSRNMINILKAVCSICFITENTKLKFVEKGLRDADFLEQLLYEAKDRKIFPDDDWRYATAEAIIDEKSVVLRGRDAVLDRFNALTGDSRTSRMLSGDAELDINFVDIFEQNKVVLILMPEHKFPTYELKDIIMTYFLSRLWLSGQRRAYNIPDRNDRKVVHIIMDEIHQLNNSTLAMCKNIAEDRKFRTTYIYTCQHLKQFGDLLDEAIGTGSHMMFFSGTQEKNYEFVKTLIDDEYEISDLMNMPKFHSFNLNLADGSIYSKFIVKIPPELHTLFGYKRGKDKKLYKVRDSKNKGKKDDAEKEISVSLKEEVKFFPTAIYLNGVKVEDDGIVFRSGADIKKREKKWYHFWRS